MLGRVHLFLATFAVAAFASVVSLVFWPSTAPAVVTAAKSETPEPVKSAEPVVPPFASSGQCAGCHGRSALSDQEHAAEAVSLDEYGRWLDGPTPDPHSLPRGFNGDRSNPYYRDPVLADQICRRIGLAESSKAESCLACHFHAAYASGAHRTKEVAADAFAFGMGCRACHGLPNKWIAAHEAWHRNKASDETKEKLGYNALNRWDIRVDICAGCHIGAPADLTKGLAARDLTHDMYAAGHPWVPYEFGRFQEEMHPHWNASFDRTKTEDYDARAWLVGQIAGARSLVRLTRYRAMQHAEGAQAPWPELTEYDCFSCHHDLSSDRRFADAELSRTRTPGDSRWYGEMLFPLLPRLANQPIFADSSFNQSWSQLAKLMQQGDATPESIVQSADQVETALTTMLSAVESAPDVRPELQAELLRIVESAHDLNELRPEELSQLIDAVAAVTRTSANPPPPVSYLFESSGYRSPKAFPDVDPSVPATLQKLKERLSSSR